MELSRCKGRIKEFVTLEKKFIREKAVYVPTTEMEKENLHSLTLKFGTPRKDALLTLIGLLNSLIM